MNIVALTVVAAILNGSSVSVSNNTFEMTTVIGPNAHTLSLPSPPCARGDNEQTGDIAYPIETGCTHWIVPPAYWLQRDPDPLEQQTCNPHLAPPKGFRCVEKPWPRDGALTFGTLAQ